MASLAPSSESATRSKPLKVLSRREIEGLIADGRKIIIVQGNVLKCDAWLPFHPGGDKAILHMIGRDATDEVTAYVHAPLRRVCF
jgi:delta8-fatty-acid desaturase